MSSAPKLTKKQKKGIAFRERKSGKGAHKDANADGVENVEIPEMEIQDLVDAEVDQMEVGIVGEKEAGSNKKPKGHVSNKGKERAEEKGDASVSASKKRKRETNADIIEQEIVNGKSQAKKQKKGASEEEGGPSTKEKNKQRFILFIGNLKYTTSVDSIKAHFAACDPPPTVRLLTPKSASTTTKSKGCAFLEFTHRNALQQALKLHHSQLDGRSINVELTAGGGGKSDSRLSKLKERNKKLFSQRKERSEKKSDGSTVSKAQRYSATAGIGEAPTAKKTWTVDDAEDGGTHRGGKKHNKSKEPRRRTKEWGSGANAIPVG